MLSTNLGIPYQRQDLIRTLIISDKCNLVLNYYVLKLKKYNLLNSTGLSKENHLVMWIQNIFNSPAENWFWKIKKMMSIRFIIKIKKMKIT